MKIQEFSNELKEKLRLINIKLEDKQIEEFYNYMNLLLEWNERINLTAITEPIEVILKHFVDSATIIKYIEDNKKIVDVGTGAGFPGIPLNIINSKASYTLVDSLNKRINFLNEVINSLQLNNINTIHSRIEDFGRNNKERFDIATSRAVASLNILLEYLLPLVKIGGICICMKGSNVKEEIESASKALEILGGKIEKVEKIILPDSDIERNIVIVKKVKSAPSKYPRKAGMATKEPIL
ncbi:MAG: 16S rRNA (guanine(527)-N(7))-methyltransferase RsmG [Clostridia bacterium]|nr:16S rRNA (guanine(527)-N(7))-methyltransferase RsmG [Clostridia bacterium]